jgi:hypothetical protein
MQTIIAIWAVVTQLIPQVLQMIQTIESHFPQGGQGQQKLAMVRSALEAVFHTLDQTTVTFEQVWPALQPIIAGAVTIYNQTGVFHKTQP